MKILLWLIYGFSPTLFVRLCVGDKVPRLSKTAYLEAQKAADWVLAVIETL
jgi:hypothetical protein